MLEKQEIPDMPERHEISEMQEVPEEPGVPETMELVEEDAKINMIRSRGVSIITATNKPEFMKNLFMNFRRQLWETKEIIVLLNNDSMNIESYRRYAKDFGQVSIYQLPAKSSLGKCLNYGIIKAKYEIIAKFDDDDFYSPYYLSEAMAEFERNGAEVIGKNKFYMYFRSSAKLMHANMPTKRFVAGATIMFKKKIYPGVAFSNLRKGSDMRFLKDCMKKGYKICSSSQYNFAAIRRENQKKHTWKVTARTIRILRAKTVARTSRYHHMVSRAFPNK